MTWIARQLEISAESFADYTRRPQTVTDHACRLAAALSLRPPTRADLPLMIEAAAQAAWSTDQGRPIVEGVIAALRGSRIVLPATGVIERNAIAGRARARRRAADALLTGTSDEQMAKLDQLLTLDAGLLHGSGWLASAPAGSRGAALSPTPGRWRAVQGQCRSPSPCSTAAAPGDELGRV